MNLVNILSRMQRWIWQSFLQQTEKSKEKKRMNDNLMTGESRKNNK